MSRRSGPFFGDVADPERSLFFWAYNLGKRSVTLDLEAAGDRERLLELLQACDGAAQDVAAARARARARAKHIKGCQEDVRKLSRLLGLEVQQVVGREVRNHLGRRGARTASRGCKLRQRRAREPAPEHVDGAQFHT